MSSREAFENSQGKDLSLATRDDGTYISVATDIAWTAWQAATERAATICAAMGDSSSVEYAGHGCVVAADKIREGNE